MSTTSSTTAQRSAPPAPRRDRLSDAQLGKLLRQALIGAKACMLRDEPQRRLSCHAFSYMAGYLEDDAQVSDLLKAFARCEFDHTALGDTTTAKAEGGAL